MNSLIRRCFQVVAIGLLWAGSAAFAQAIPVELVRNEDGGWRLLRGGEPYFVKGAGIGGQKTREAMENLVAAGGNSLRTWGIGPDTQEVLDTAHELGLTVTLGIWMKHDADSYADPAWVAAEVEKVREQVLRFKDHPALLIWGVGNEMERPKSPHRDAIWAGVNAVAAMIKEVDPYHPTMTVVAEIGKTNAKVERIHTLCPAIDIVGINAYVGAPTIARRYRAEGDDSRFPGVKPYIITEYAQHGQWDIPKGKLGTKVEPTSTQKGAAYRKAYVNGVLPEKGGLCLGSYAFNWGIRPGVTMPTWFGTHLPDGDKLAVVDVLTELWTGQPPANRCPSIGEIDLGLDGPARVKPGQALRASVEVEDPEGDPLAMSWVLVETSEDYPKQGANAKPIAGAIVQSAGGRAVVRAPREPGLYRLYAFARDGKGGAAYANTVVLVESQQGAPE